jgi:hypothetical protein
MNAKAILLIGVTLQFCRCLDAQTVVTNWIAAAPEFREVNGQLYNTEKSVRFVALSGKCTAVFTNGFLLQQIETRPIYETYRTGSSDSSSYGNFLGGGSRPAFASRKVRDEEILLDVVFVSNYPASIGRGSRINCRAVSVGRVEYKGETYSAYDYGLPHVVPVLVTNAPALANQKPK